MRRADAGVARRLARRRRTGALALPALVLAALAAPRPGRADSLVLRLEPGYQASSNTTTAEGTRTEVDSAAILQKYTLTLDKTLWPFVRFGGGGMLDWAQGSQKSPTGQTDSDTKRWLGYGRLEVGGPTARGGVGYDRREDISRFEPRGGTASSTRLVNEVYTGWATLLPEGLPIVELQVSRTESHDAARVALDQRRDVLQLMSRYAPVQSLDLRYTLQASESVDGISKTDTQQLTNFGRVSYQDRFLDRRLTTYASYDVTRTDTRITVSGLGGTVSEQQFPIRGLSALEVFPAVPERIALDQNPALIDANTTASAGIDIGYSRTTSSDNHPRHLALQLADVVTPVNVLYVWIDRQLPSDVAVAYSAAGRWRAYASDDNLSWTPVSVGPVAFATFANRFEISIAETRARYVKIVTDPLPVGVTFDPQLASVFVTELQAFRVRPASEVQGRQGTTSGSFTGGLRYELESVRGLSYDLATTVRHGGQVARPTWLVVNGLNYMRKLSTSLLLTSRLERGDSDDGQGHIAGSRYALTLGATPLPTLSATVNLSGGYEQGTDQNELRNALLATATAELYTGVAVTTTGSAGHSAASTGRDTTVLESRTTLSLQPHRAFSMSGTFAASDTRAEGGGQPDLHAPLGRVEATASFAPVRALYTSASVTRYLYGAQAPATLANFGAAVSPLPGGPLLLRFNYQESLDTAQELRTRTYGPGLRWNIRRGWWVDSSYSVLQSTSPAVTTDSRVFFVSLFATIGQ